MEKTYIHKREPMAHKVREIDVPIDLFERMRVKATSIVNAGNTDERTTALAHYIQSLRDYGRAYGFEVEKIDKDPDFSKIGDEKTKKFGRFADRVIGVLDGKPKLVRDNVPEYYPESSTPYRYHKAQSDEEFAKVLHAKVLEETLELQVATTREKRAEELVDIFEVIDYIIENDKLDRSTIETRRQKNEVDERRERRGLAKRRRLNVKGIAA